MKIRFSERLSTVILITVGVVVGSCAGGAVKLSISFNEQVVRVNGTVRGREGSGVWRSAPAGCEGHSSAAIAE